VIKDVIETARDIRNARDNQRIITVKIEKGGVLVHVRARPKEDDLTVETNIHASPANITKIAQDLDHETEIHARSTIVTESAVQGNIE
jgi:hypothetical protein